MSLAKTNKFLERLEARQADLRRFGVRRVGLFGSCSRGEERPDSDVDLLVWKRTNEASSS
jgi:predicted nucleotidyltransferase